MRTRQATLETARRRAISRGTQGQLRSENAIRLTRQLAGGEPLHDGFSSGTAPEVVDSALSYLRIRACAVPVVICINAAQSGLMAQQNSVRPSIATLSAAADPYNVFGTVLWFGVYYDVGPNHLGRSSQTKQASRAIDGYFGSIAGSVRTAIAGIGEPRTHPRGLRTIRRASRLTL